MEGNLKIKDLSEPLQNSIGEDNLYDIREQLIFLFLYEDGSIYEKKNLRGFVPKY